MISSADLFRPSAISGLIRLRRELANFPNKSPGEVCRLLSATYANAGVDFEAAVQLHEVMPALPEGTPEAFQCVISELVLSSAPSWLGLLRRGRDALFSVVGADVRTCFERAGALEPIPESSVVKWLDSLVSLAYAQNDAKLLAFGREAEYLSYEFERNRLAEHAAAPEVEWVALNDNSAGFDLRSASLKDGVFVPRLIEVKSSQKDPPRIIITRHEWDVACRIGDAYVFHVWHLASRLMREVPFQEMSVHVPLDQGRGTWESVQIEISASL
jgi:hypothetical protein